ncbi:hypothetical protein CLF_101266 [Clonorchis sinensis]|uniref:Uncharacterized protein n=1 Tax=Clonorchis sinensis TaxID=79923 RepID=G7Y5D4_CLOSI|nr:hypothetical protein CLF_101266 [Clonorchis sinensis]
MDRLRKSASSVGMMSSNTSGERCLPTATSDTPDPGAYEIKSFLDKWNRPEHSHAGKFRRITDQMPLGKIYAPAVGTSAQIGPGKYDPVLPKKKETNCQNVPFLSRSSRYAGSIFAHHPVQDGMTYNATMILGASGERCQHSTHKHPPVLI